MYGMGKYESIHSFWHDHRINIEITITIFRVQGRIHDSASMAWGEIIWLFEAFVSLIVKYSSANALDAIWTDSDLNRCEGTPRAKSRYHAA